jgi:hypothetical protein
MGRVCRRWAWFGELDVRGREAFPFSEFKRGVVPLPVEIGTWCRNEPKLLLARAHEIRRGVRVGITRYPIHRECW